MDMRIRKLTSKAGKTGIYLVMTLLLTLYGCISDPKISELEDTLRAYERAVRWSDFQLVPGFRGKEKASEVLAGEKLKSIKVTGYTARQLLVSDTGMAASQIVEVRYYDENVAREHAVIDRQKWVYDSDVDHWVLVSQLPAFFYP
jgi:hypothetical protein